MIRKHPLVNINPVENEEKKQLRSPRKVHSSDDPESEPGPSTSSHYESPNEQLPATQPVPEKSHSVQLSNTSKQTSQTTVSSFLKKKMGASSRKKIDDALLMLITKDFQPFSIVEDYGFREFVNALNPSYELPSRKKLSNTSLQASFEKTFHDCQTLLTDVKAVTLTTDCWTSRNSENFMAVTAHFINQNFKLQSMLLDCSSYGESHTSENLSNELKKVIFEWNLDQKILMVISDNAANIRKAIKDDLKLKHFGCYAHTINLVAQDALKGQNLSDLIGKAKTIVAFFKRSTSAMAKLNEQQKRINPDSIPKKLIQEVATRWNSTYFLLERFVELEEPLRTTIALLNKDLPIICLEEWNFFKEILKVLKPLEQLTSLISGENYLVASSVIILTDGLLNVYRNLQKQDFMPLTLIVINSIIDGIKKRLGDLELSNTLIIATFLDPRYKNLGFSNDQVSDKVKRSIIARVVQIINSKRNDRPEEEEVRSEHKQATGSEEMSIWSNFEKKLESFQPTGTAQSKAIIEVQRYMEEPPISRQEEPLNWWKNNAYNFPNLAELVKTAVVPVATSVPCERIFSKSGLILSDRRARLSSSKVKMILFLNTNQEY